MATEVGTATDYRDLVQKVKAFLTGTNSPSSGLNWQVMREYSDQSSPDSSLTGSEIPDVDDITPDDVAVHEIIFKGTGGQSPELGIYWGLRTFQVNANSIFSWEVRAYTGYTDTSPATDFHSQPGKSFPVFMPLQNTTMDYWFFGTERRFIAVVKTGTNYQWLHAGLLNTFATQSEYPYPMMIAASTWDPGDNFANNSPDVSSFVNPHGASTPGTASGTYPGQGAGCGNCYVRWIDGTWHVCRNRFDQSGNDQPATNYTSGEMGMCPGLDFNTGTYYDVDDRESASARDFQGEFYSASIGGNAASLMNQGLGSPAPLILIPITVMRPVGHNIIGEVDGVYWVPGTGGVTSEDTVSDSGVSPEKEYLIFQDVHRTDPWTFCAIRND